MTAPSFLCQDCVSRQAQVSARDSAPEVSVVVPLRDEEATLAALFHALRRALDPDMTFELILVDDGSTDGSLDVLRRLRVEDARVRPIHLRRNFGKAGALSTGMLAARGRCVVTMDADLQDDPAEIRDLIARLDEGFDVVSGWKVERQDPWQRRAASHIFNRMTSRLSGLRLHDVNCGLKAYSRECAREVARCCYGEHHRFLPVIAHWHGFRVTEMPVTHHPRTTGRSRYGLERYLRGLLDLVTTTFLARYARRPMHVFGMLGLLLLVPGVLLLAGLLVEKVVLGHSLSSRPLLLLSALLCTVGVQLLLAGLLAEMVSRTPALVPRALRQSGAFPAVFLNEDPVTAAASEPATAPASTPGRRFIRDVEVIGERRD